MIVVADASVLVAELLRERGRALFARPDLRVVVAEEQWNETEHELQRRLGIIVDQGRLTTKQAQLLHEAVQELVDDRAIEIIPRTFYAHHEAVARRRVPRDPGDWPPVALALALEVGILTGDEDFLGCGCATWTVENLTRGAGPPLTKNPLAGRATGPRCVRRTPTAAYGARSIRAAEAADCGMRSKVPTGRGPTGASTVTTASGSP